MNRMLAFVGALLLMGSLGAPADLLAQAKGDSAKEGVGQDILRSQTNRTQDAIQNQIRQGVQTIEGRIKSVDRTGRHVTLEDGTKLTILKDVKVPKDALKAGAMVTAQYEEKDGQKVVSSIYVKPGPKS